MGKGEHTHLGFPGSSVSKHLPANAGDMGSIPRSGRSPGEGNGTHSSIFDLETWTEESAGLKFMGFQKSQIELGD